MALQRIKLNDVERIETVIIKGGCSPTYIWNTYKPDIFINGILFDNATREVITNCKTRKEGKQGYLFYEDGIGIRNEKPIWINKWDALKDDSVTDFIGSAPSIIINGNIDIQKKDITNSFYGTTTYRSGIGFNDNEFILFSGDVKYSFANYAKYISTIGVKYFINLDGGGSCCLVKNGVKLHGQYDGRLIPHWILVYLKKTTNTTNIKKEDDEVVQKIKINIDGKIKEVDAIVKDGRTYVQLRAFESEGYKITYENGIAGIEHPKK